MTTCPQCGAVLPGDQQCRDRFDADQVMELEAPAYYPVHHLSVPCYMLQHNAYSREGWLSVRQLLARFLVGLTPGDARREFRGQMNSGRRSWSITKGEKLPGVELIAWTRTIADIRTDTPDHYCADVRAWAASLLADTEPLMQTLGPTS